MATTGSGKGRARSAKGAVRGAGATAKRRKRAAATGLQKETAFRGNGRKSGTRSMGSLTVRELLRQINRLPESDRLLLEKQLAQRAEAEWLRDAKAARAVARARAIDQAAIDRAVEEVRYPPRPNGDRG